MQDISLLVEGNKQLCRLNHLVQFNLNYYSDITKFDFFELRKLISFFYSADKKYGNLKLICYNLIYNNQIEFADKLTYVLFECLLYDQIINNNKRINLNLNYKSTIQTNGIRYTCIGKYIDKDNFKKEFNEHFYLSHYRKVISFDSYKNNSGYLSDLMSEIQIFLKNDNFDLEQTNKISEISIELVGNALEHAMSDCLIDIDFSPKLYKKINDKNPKTSYFTVNIVVLSFSENAIGDKIKQICLDNTINAKQFNKLKDIYTKHKKYFDEIYTEKHFFTMSAFQDKITSREGNFLTGGKGLTKLINGLQDMSDSYICYMVSDQITLVFFKEFIRQDEDKWVGFNIENDVNLRPSRESFVNSPLKIKGTAYNLAFMLKKENE